MRDEQPDDTDLRRYLLGELTETEEDRIESLLLQHDELYERCEAVESDLLDDFESGALSAGERRRVEAWLDASPELQLRQQIVRSVRNIPAPNILRPKFTVPSWAKRAAIAAALLMAADLFWLESRPGWKTPPIDVPPHIPIPPPLDPLPPVRDRPRPPRPSMPEVTVLDISLEVRRDAPEELQKVLLGKEAKKRKLRFLLDFPPQTARFKVTLLDAGGSAVGSWNEVKVRTVLNEPALIVTLPSEKLPAGRYTVQAEPIRPGPDDVPIEMGFEMIGGPS